VEIVSSRPASDQREAVAFLSRGQSHGLGTERVERIDTHISAVFLAGGRAYKMKRAVTFPYLDYSTLELRRRACERELRLNRRTAPHLYRAVVAVTREPDGGLALGGAGEPVEWLVEMVRFDQDQLLDRLAAAGRLEVPLAVRLARTVAAFHEHALPRRDCDAVGAMRRVLDDNVREMLDDASGTFDAGRCRALHAASMAAVERHAFLMDARRMHGLVRQCHGDLHLHNVCLVGGEPILFDAIEFNDELSCIDVAYDFAFLLMDLWHRHLPVHANAALNAYFERRPDYAGLLLLPLYLSCRAAIRAKVSVAEAAVQADGSLARPLLAEAAEYLRLAERFLERRRPTLAAIGGFSGSGKTTLAARLAPSLGAAPGAVVLRTDVIRKRLFGADAQQRLPESAYDPEVTALVYARAFHAAEGCLRAGQSVVLDAVFADPRHRQAAERLAIDTGVPLAPLWLDVPFEIAAGRLGRRTHDASDATVRVLRKQLQAGAGYLTWLRLDASADPDRLAAAACRAIEARANAAATDRVEAAAR
jgi:hypothetical protein